jgi:hypothetical protein
MSRDSPMNRPSRSTRASHISSINLRQASRALWSPAQRKKTTTASQQELVMAFGKRSLIFAGLTAAMLAGTLSGASTATARTPFDGKWSVLIVTDAGTCDRAYRYALNIVNGRVTYDDPSFDISGHVDGRGDVSVNVSAGGQRASGSGELSGDYGHGRWRGNSSTSACSGHWEAERRG